MELIDYVFLMLLGVCVLGLNWRIAHLHKIIYIMQIGDYDTYKKVSERIDKLEVKESASDSLVAKPDVVTSKEDS